MPRVKISEQVRSRQELTQVKKEVARDVKLKPDVSNVRDLLRRVERLERILADLLHSDD